MTGPGGPLSQPRAKGHLTSPSALGTGQPWMAYYCVQSLWKVPDSTAAPLCHAREGTRRKQVRGQGDVRIRGPGAGAVLPGAYCQPPRCPRPGGLVLGYRALRVREIRRSSRSSNGGRHGFAVKSKDSLGLRFWQSAWALTAECWLMCCN